MPSMKLYKISQVERNGCDTFDSAVICAESECQARYIHPEGTVLNLSTFKKQYDWCSSPESVMIEYIGKASPDLKPGVIVASYNGW